MGKNKNTRKRPLNTSSSSSNMGDLSMDRSIVEEKSGVKDKSETLHENPELQTTACGVVSLRTASDSDKDASNLSYNSSSDNLCASVVTDEQKFESYFESLARRRSLSLDSRPEQMKSGLNNPIQFTKTKTLSEKDFLKVVSPRRLESQRRWSDRKEDNLRQHLTHPKKKIKTSIFNSPIFDKSSVSDSIQSLVVNEESITCVDLNATEKFVDQVCVDQMCANQKSLEESVTSSKDLNFKILNEMKMTALSNANEIRQGEVIAIDKSLLIPNGVINEVNKTLIKQVSESKANSQSRPPMTEEQKRRLREVQSRTVFIDGHKDELRKYFKHMPRKLNKEIIEKTRGEVDKVFITQQGVLKIVAKDEAQRNQLLKIKSLNDKPVRTSIPFSLTFKPLSNNKPPPVKKQETVYFVKGVVFGLLENEENLNEIALEIGAHHIHRLGNPEFSKATLIAYPKETVLPEFLEVNGRKYRVHPYVSKPMRCDRCQCYGHRTGSCTREVVCSRCAGNHAYVDCLEKTKLKCANCGEAHSAAHRSCAVYIKTQAALKIRAEQNITFADAMLKVDEIQSENVNVDVPKTNGVTYASKVKNGIEIQAKIRSISVDVQTSTDVQIASNGETCPEDDLLKKFLSFNEKDFTIINTDKSINDTVEEYDQSTKIKMSFVLGVLATIEKAKSREHAQYVICHAASKMLFDNKIKFIYKDW